ncbi:hypothetical protein SASPL_123819 [Salvia splendens]|uniref:Peptidase A1 domain-containing protein n=1 Tax=Salvia splendens TaxID=180675 RepID=A0A8X8XQK4_SALSN|nr:hypothetical protein SASPL_123819 [Salvia splendens]
MEGKINEGEGGTSDHRSTISAGKADGERESTGVGAEMELESERGGRLGYSDGSATLGVFANETVTFSLANGRKARLHDVLVGCSQSARGQSFEAADGVMGLGYSNYSLAVKAAGKFGGKFSYCLVDHLSPENVSSYLIFGSHNELNISVTRIRYTELVLGVINPFYAVNVKGISVGDIMLDIPDEVWDLSDVGGAIVDSGTSLTVLTQPAYQPVMAALRQSLQAFKRLDLDIA